MNRRDFVLPRAVDDAEAQAAPDRVRLGADHRQGAAPRSVVELTVGAASGGGRGRLLRRLSLPACRAGAAPAAHRHRARRRCADDAPAARSTAMRQRMAQPARRRAALAVDLGARREFGGVFLQWRRRRARLATTTCRCPTTAGAGARCARCAAAGASCSAVAARSEARYLRSRCAAGRRRRYGLAELRVMGPRRVADAERFPADARPGRAARLPAARLRAASRRTGRWSASTVAPHTRRCCRRGRRDRAEARPGPRSSRSSSTSAGRC